MGKVGAEKKFLCTTLGFIIVNFATTSLAMEPHITEAKLKTFALVQKVMQTSDTIIDQLSKTDHVYFPRIQRTINPSWQQTRSGVYLYTSYYPYSLATPWGEIKLYDAEGDPLKKSREQRLRDHLSSQYLKSLIRSINRLFKEIPVSFQYCSGERPYEINPSEIEDNRAVAFWEHELDLSHSIVKGTSKIIVPLLGFSLYALTDCDQIFAEDASFSSRSSSWDTWPSDFLSEEQYRPRDDVVQEFSMLKKLYEQTTTSR